MKVGIIGAGYVGLVAAACIAEMGHDVLCVENDKARLASLRTGTLPFYEPGLHELVTRNVEHGRLKFSASLPEVAAPFDAMFIAVNTPTRSDGSADLSFVLEAAREIGRWIGTSCVVVNKSTVPVGTAEVVQASIDQEIEKRRLEVEVVSNPEFLREGNAVNDFMQPDRVVIGASSEQTIGVMRRLYRPFTHKTERIFVMSRRDAEMAKYAANACELMGVDVEQVRLVIGADSRIGYSYIYPGCGYGGSCFPKDMQSLIHMCGAVGSEPMVLRAVEERNRAQKQRLFEKIRARFRGRVEGLTVAVWGLAFKPDTDDMREAPSIGLVNALVQSGARVRAHDPVARATATRVFPKEWFSSAKLELLEDHYEAAAGADALVLVTEWKIYRNPDLEKLGKLLRHRLIFDGRNQFDPDTLGNAGFEYCGIGRSSSLAASPAHRKRNTDAPGAG